MTDLPQSNAFNRPRESVSENHPYLSNRLTPSPSLRPKTEHPTADAGPAQPSSTGNDDAAHAEHDEGVEAGDLRAPAIQVLGGDNGPEGEEGGGARDHRGAKVDEAALLAQVEEAVPG